MDECGTFSPQGSTEKGPHLKRQLHSADESHRYALFWPGSAARQLAKPSPIRPTIGAGRDKITRCVMGKGISLGSYPSQMFQFVTIRLQLNEVWLNKIKKWNSIQMWKCFISTLWRNFEDLWCYFGEWLWRSTVFHISNGISFILSNVFSL